LFIIQFIIKVAVKTLPPATAINIQVERLINNISPTCTKTHICLLLCSSRPQKNYAALW